VFVCLVWGIYWLHLCNLYLRLQVAAGTWKGFPFVRTNLETQEDSIIRFR